MTDATSRLMTVADAPAMAALLRANRTFLAPWEPERTERYFTDDGQREVTEEALQQYERGAIVPHVIVEGDRIVGRIALTGIVRGPFQSGSIGYWVAQDANGRGVGSAALASMVRFAFTELGLHRLEAGVRRHNIGSQRVLEHNGFQRFGVAPRYLKIAGEWRDHILFQLLNE